MCELLGINTNTSIDPRGYLSSFYSHSSRHPHGWGIMRCQKGKVNIVKEAVCALNSNIIDKIVQETEPQTNMLAHIRLATIGGTKYNNCHPFSDFDSCGRRWTMIHNGTIYSGAQLTKYLSKQIGDTDSERIFLYLLDEINKAISLNNAPLSAEQRCKVVSSIAAALSPRNKLNLMIYDGEILYIHKNMKDTLVYKELDNGYVISTQPLDDGYWQQVPMTQVFAFKNGRHIYSGAKHNHEFVPTLEYITALDAMNI